MFLNWVGQVLAADPVGLAPGAAVEVLAGLGVGVTLTAGPPTPAQAARSKTRLASRRDSTLLLAMY
jgi:hypothetical protein